MSAVLRDEFDVQFRGVTKQYGNVVAVDGVDLAIAAGQFVSILGPSGCGKTTSLRMIAGFDDPTAGDVRIGGRSVVGVPAYRRPVNMVFQHYALFPHLDVAGNVAYGPRQARPRPSRAEIDRRVAEVLELVRLPGYQARRVWELSGGQQQRVALARALVNHPTVLLLDEPLAALDRKLRREMQMELQTLQREVGITFVLVTHDQEEALSMSDAIAIMREGRIEQFGSPRVLYDAPRNRYVADFVGESSFLPGTVIETAPQQVAVRTDAGPVVRAPVSPNGDEMQRGMRAAIAIRPEVIMLWNGDADVPDDLDCRFPATVTNHIFLGNQSEYRVVADVLGELLVRTGKAAEARTGVFRSGDRVNVGWRRDAALALTEH